MPKRLLTNSPLGPVGWCARLVQVLVLLQVACALIVFDPSAVDTFVLPKSGLSYLIGAVMAASLLVGIYLRQVNVRWSALHSWVVAMSFCFVLATPQAVDANVAIFGFDRRAMGLAHIAESLVLFLSISLTFTSRRQFALLIGSATATATLVSAYGLLQMTGHDFVSYTEGTLRPIATVGQPDTLGALVAIVAITCAAILALQWSALGVVRRILLGLAAAMALGVAYGDGVRVAILALVGGLAGALVSRPSRSWQAGAAVAFAVAFALGLAVMLASPLASRITPAQLRDDRSLQGRLEMLQTDLAILASRPVLGVGPDNFGVVYPLMRQDRSVALNGVDVLQSSPHSLFGYVMTSTGTLGLLAFAGVWFIALRSIRRLASVENPAQFAAVPLGAFFVQSFVSVVDPALDWIWWAALGIIASGTSTVVQVHASRRLSSALASTVVIGGLAAVVAFAIGWADFVNRIAASEASGRAEHLIGLRKPLAAVQEAALATRLDSTRGAPWARLGTALAAAGNPSAAESAFTEAMRREPWQPAWWRGIAVQRLALGHVEGAAGALEAALRADPHDTSSLDLLARLALNAGNIDAAVGYGDRVLELYPGKISYYDVPVLAHERRGEWQVAELEIRRGLGFASGSEQPHLHVLLAELFSATGRRVEALAELEWLLANAPSDPETADIKLRLGPSN